MKYDLSIREHNRQAHLDIEEDVKLKKNGLFTFTLRVNNGNIVDYNVVEVVNGKQYFNLGKIIVTELAFTRNYRVAGGSKPVLPNNFQCSISKRDS